MKQSSVIATVILAAAVLLAAYAIGRLIRQARLDEPPPQAVAEPNDANEAEAVMMSRRINRTRREMTAEEKARIKQERAEALAQRDDLTDEEKQKLRDDLRETLRVRGGAPGQVPQLSPEQLKSLSKQWPQMTEAEREQAKAAFRARMRSGRGSGSTQPAPNTPATEAAAQTPAAEPN